MSDNPANILLEDGQTQSSQAALLEPAFKALMVNGRRKGIKLEKIYWDILDELAMEKNIDRSELVSEILAEAPSEGLNTSSVLRCYVVDVLEKDRRDLSARLRTINAVNLLQVAPVPSFAINLQKKLLRVNPEFVQLLRLVAGNMAANVQPDTSQLTLDIPVSQLFAELQSGAESTQCGYTVSVDGRTRRGRAKIVAAPPFPATVLIGYVIN